MELASITEQLFFFCLSKKGLGVIREHIKKHKIMYLMSTAVIAGITLAIMKGRYEALANGGAYGPETADTLATMRSFFVLSNNNQPSITINRIGPGRPSYLIHDVANDLYLGSQRDAARMYGIPEPVLSKHVTGKIPNAYGMVFERIPVEA